MNLNSYHSVHFLGIGGIGMSALARWFNHQGKKVSGYDKTPSDLTAELQKEGMEISFNDDLNEVPERVIQDKEQTLIIWTPAIPKDAVLYRYFLSEGYQMKKRAEVLGIITSGYPAIAVAGTHGKTTTASMIAHLLKSGDINIAAFLGGVTQNYANNLILQEESKEEVTVVVEADEFDRSFLHLHPKVSVLTSADADHLDIYGDDSRLKEGFADFINLLPNDGVLYIQEKAFAKLQGSISEAIQVRTYGLDSGEIHTANMALHTGYFEFDFKWNQKTIPGLTLNMPGYHNVENALPAIAISMEMGIADEKIKEGLSGFKGVKRRFEIWVNRPDRIYIDDYAHHPEEIRAFLRSVKDMFPEKKLVAIFQPHLYSRTRDFAKGFAESLSIADEVILLDIYPARELPIPGVESQMLLEDIISPKKSLMSKEQLLEYLEKNRPELLVTMGAGDIDRLVSPIAKMMKENEN